MELLERVIVGAGVVGAALAHAFRGRGETLLLERAERVATGISTRNSGVIHAGLYYPPESLKLRFCLRGAHLLYAFAAERGVAHRRTGKFLVANGAEELAQLETLLAHAGEARLERVEPPANVRAEGALFSPNTGIVDPHAFVEALIAASDATVLFGQEVAELVPERDWVRIRVNGEWHRARRVYNCAGLGAAPLAREQQALARGSYFRLKIPSGLSLPPLIYPAVPKQAASLGIHLTQNIWGEAYLGPDLEWIEREDYAVDPARLESFLVAARQYLPWLEASMLEPGYAGIRPKRDRHGFHDFAFPREGSCGQLVHCLGIESPGLTAAMAIGEFLAGDVENGCDNDVFCR